MSHHDYLLRNMRALRDRNMLGLRVRTLRNEPNHYLLEGLDDRKVCGFLSCSYLGLEWDRRLADAAVTAIEDYGTQFSSSRAIASTAHYAAIEERLCAVMGVRPVIASTSTLAHLSAIPLLASEEDAVILDTQVHNSVHMAVRQCTLAGTATFRIPHNDLAALEGHIVRLRKDGKRRIWYMADGLYSMYGDFADMEALFRLMARYDNFHCYIDDAHSVGWIGRHGAGHAAPWFHEPHADRMVVVGSMAKTFAACGGMVLTPRDEWRELIASCGETMIFSGPLQPAVCGSLLAACDIMRSAELPLLQATLRDHIAFFGSAVQSHQLRSLSSGRSPIFLLEIGSMERLQALSAHLLESGYYVPPVTFPAVPLNRFCIRVVINRLHTRAQMLGLVEVLAQFESKHPRAGSAEHQVPRKGSADLTQPCAPQREAIT
ncbi:aminotransferase class I/II-fold pyridoxal phosphate-dependent enzyme [Ramlibacter sp. AN1015]|uniref:aminotransferase class I/II-fold pyridoxal phosphate-dependent enzyme n=1 Tax=Ramlibacter sp. AN1015 TaxID=3133428 RepID=UPI0030BA3EC5